MISPTWIEERDALILHERLIALHGGAPGVRDQGRLSAALARPQQHAAYGDESSILDLAARLTAGIVRNHPFVDGNKRTGFVLGVLFLELNGFVFNASQEDAANAVLALASGMLDEQGYARFLRANVAPASP
jgi:death-on-curing protein